MPGPRKGSRRLDRALREAQARLARHYAALAGADPVDVLQARVASRRIRSLLKTFSGHFQHDTAGQYRRDLGRAARQLGPLRELDVLANQPGMRSGPVAQALSLARRAEVSRVQRRLRAGKRWRATVFEGPTAGQLGLEPGLSRGDVERAVRRQWLRVERLLASHPTDPGALHVLRIGLKKFRYAFETVEDTRDENVASLLACLRSAQDQLGAEHDITCACHWLERSDIAPAAVRASLRRLQRQSHVLAARRPRVLRNLERAGRHWYGTTR